MGGIMEQWMANCLRLGRPKRYLTYTEVNENLPADQEDPEKLDDFLLLLEKEGIELRDDPAPKPPRTPTPDCLDEMVFHRFAPAILEGWKSYPIRVQGPRSSECHGKPTLLVQSMIGGFVSANCSESECGKKHPLSKGDFFSLSLWVGCPQCRAPMQPEMLSQVRGPARLAPNYGFICGPCRTYIPLADLLPLWKDLV